MQGWKLNSSLFTCVGYYSPAKKITDSGAFISCSILFTVSNLCFRYRGYSKLTVLLHCNCSLVRDRQYKPCCMLCSHKPQAKLLALDRERSRPFVISHYMILTLRHWRCLQEKLSVLLPNHLYLLFQGKLAPLDAFTWALSADSPRCWLSPGLQPWEPQDHHEKASLRKGGGRERAGAPWEEKWTHFWQHRESYLSVERAVLRDEHFSPVEIGMKNRYFFSSPAIFFF